MFLWDQQPTNQIKPAPSMPSDERRFVDRQMPVGEGVVQVNLSLYYRHGRSLNPQQAARDGVIPRNYLHQLGLHGAMYTPPYSMIMPHSTK